MAKIEKYSTGIVGVIKHNIREFNNGICPTNMEVDPTRKGENYSIIRRGNTAKEIEDYRKKIENECFHYNRKNIIHANEVICTLPSDCPPEQERLFFVESFKYICSTLPMGERCVFLAEIHADEGKILKDGITVIKGSKHLHVMYVPAVPDLKHSDYEFKLCSDALTRRSILKQWHPNYQQWLDKAGVHCTVASGVTSGRGISVRSLKEISKETGLSLDQIKSLEKETKLLHEKLMQKEREQYAIHQVIEQKNSIITELKEYAAERDQLLKTASEKINFMAQELSRAQDRIREFEKVVSQPEKEHTWGNNSWGSNTGWGRSDRTYEEDKTW